MKTYFKSSFYLMAAAMSVVSFFACGDDDPNPLGGGSDEKSKLLAPIVEQYVNKTVIPTYNKLANSTIVLVEKLKALKAEKTDANVMAATNAWIETRVHWEQSEAFLFGAVADFGIDPHIDTWPLDQEQLAKELANADHMASMAAEGGDVWAGEYLGNALLGFHGIEYVIFKEGEPKTAASLVDDELAYAVAVAGDLRNRCIQLEVSWAGEDNVDKSKVDLMTELDLAITASNSSLSYGDNMLTAGQPGSTYKTVAAAVAQILDGAFMIADEVGNIKIGNAAGGDDVNYIESPFSYNSLKDFIDNIVSIENVYLGGPTDSRDAAKSVSAYIASVNADADKAVKDAITASYAAINAIPAPFVLNYADPKADEAVVIIGTTLAGALEAAIAVVTGE